MKKIICLFTIFISVFIFQMDFKIKSQNNYDKLNNISSLIAKNEHKEIFSFLVDTVDSDFYNVLLDYAQNQDETIIVNRAVQDSSLTTVKQTYIFSRDGEISLQGIYEQSGKQIDFSKPTSEYYASDFDTNSFGQIDFLDANYHKRYHSVFQIYQINEILQDKSSSHFLYIQISSGNINKTIQHMKESSLSKYASDNWEKNQLEIQDLDEEDSSLSIIMIIISAITILLLLVCEFFKKAKEITIRKMQGMSNIYIVGKVFYKQILLQLGCYMLGVIGCQAIMVGHVRPVTYPLLVSQIQFFLIFVGFQVAIYAVMYIFIKNIQHVHYMKKNNTSKNIAYLDIVLKVIVVLLILQPVIQFVSLSITEIKTAVYLARNEDLLKNQLYIDDVFDSDNADMYTTISKLKVYFQEHGGIYQDFMQNVQFVEDEENQISLPYLIVNEQFLHDYKIKDTNGDIIDFSTYKKDVVLIPQKYQNADLTMYKGASKGEKIMIENGVTYLNRDPLTALEDNLVKTDAIVLVKKELDTSTKWTYPYLLLPVGENIKSEAQKVKDAGISDGYFLSNTSTAYELTKDFIQSQVIHLLSLLFIYVFVIITFLYQTIFVYFITNKQKFALKYLYGYSFIERHGEMIVMNVSAYLIVLLIGWFCLKVQISGLIMFVILAVMFEVISAYLLIHRFEKHNVAVVLKGE